MKQLWYVIERNFAIFRKNRKNVILCFAAILIVFGLYAIFLRDFMIQSVSDCPLPQAFVPEFTDRLMLGGLLIVVNTTTCFGIMQLCIHDSEAGLKRDYLVAPVTKAKLLLGYWITSVIVSFLYTTLALTAVIIFFNMKYQCVFQVTLIGKALLLVLVSSVLNSELLFCLIVFIKDTTSFSTFGNLYGMLAGFLAGTYLPYELYPDQLKKVLYYYPPTHLTSMMRHLFLVKFEDQLEFAYADELVRSLKQIYGVSLKYKGVLCTFGQQCILLCASFTILLFFLGIIHREA